MDKVSARVIANYAKKHGRTFVILRANGERIEL